MTDISAVSTVSHWKNHPLAWPLLAILLVVTWSAGFLGIRFVNDQMSMMNLLFWRMLLAGLILLPFALKYGPKIRLPALLKQARFGAMAIFIYSGGCAIAIEQRVPTGLVALIADLLPLMIACLSQVLLNERMSRKQWLGTAIAVSGVLMVSLESFELGSAPLWAYGLTVAAMVVLALATVSFRKSRDDAMPLHQSICIQTLTACGFFGMAAWWQGDMTPVINGQVAIGMVWLIFVATYGAYFAYYGCLKLYPAAKVSAAIYLSPPLTMLVASLLFAEPFTLVMMIGLAVTMMGVVLAAK